MVTLNKGRNRKKDRKVKSDHGERLVVKRYETEGECDVRSNQL